MARKKSFYRITVDMARSSARAERERQQKEKARMRDIEKQRREQTRLATINQKEVKQRYLENRIAETEDANMELRRRIEELESILPFTLEVDDQISFNSLRRSDKFRQFVVPRELAAQLITPTLESFQAKIDKPYALGKFMPGATKKYEGALRQAEEDFKSAMANYQLQQEQREQKVALLRTAYELEKHKFQQEVDALNQEVDEFEQAYVSGEAQAVLAYCNMVLERSDYPEGFPQEFRTAFIPESKEIIIEYELPDTAIVPSVAEYTYFKAKDEIREKERKVADVKALYQDIVAAVCLRTVHELFEADQANNLDIVVFNGFVQTIDPATGRDIRPHLISLRASKEKFKEVNLARVDKRVCLRNLGAQVSPRPADMQAVKPVVDFDMVDKRFVEQSDILADIESRPNLMDLTPFEFENLISNLFNLIGFESKLTRSSKDGGVDVVAFDPRPIVGGKVVIQAKRYRNVVGVSAVRDLYGTMINEGAGKGVLVTTSHYGPDAYEFAKNKPIELIDGGGLLYLLQQQGTEARIVFPES